MREILYRNVSVSGTTPFQPFQKPSILDVSHSLMSFGTLRWQLVTRNVVVIGWRQQLESNQPVRA
jgi:hypothetical protein